MKPIIPMDPRRAGRRASRAARVTLAGIVAVTALAGGLLMAARPSAAKADGYRVMQSSQALGQMTVDQPQPPLLPPHAPPPPPPPPAGPTPPPPPPCGSPTMSLLNDEHQAAARLVQGETVTAWVTCFPAHAPVQIMFDGEALATVAVDGATIGTDTIGSQATFTMPYDVSGGSYETFTANFSGLQATYTVWYDYAPQ